MDRLLIPLRELKFADPASDDSAEFSGYGAVFGNVDAVGDVIDPGAFAECLSECQKTGVWPSMLSQHGAMGLTAADLTPVGVWSELSEDGNGLKAKGILAPTPRGQELRALMKMQPRPAIDGLSIGYRAVRYTMRSKPDEPRRRLHAVKVHEISLVTFPANGQARISQVKALDSEREIERWLMQDAGLSRREARVAINHGFKSLLGMQDATGDGELLELVDTLRSFKRSLTG